MYSDAGCERDEWNGSWWPIQLAGPEPLARNLRRPFPSLGWEGLSTAGLGPKVSLWRGKRSSLRCVTRAERAAGVGARAVVIDMAGRSPQFVPPDVSLAS